MMFCWETKDNMSFNAFFKKKRPMDFALKNKSNKYWFLKEQITPINQSKETFFSSNLQLNIKNIYVNKHCKAEFGRYTMH